MLGPDMTAPVAIGVIFVVVFIGVTLGLYYKGRAGRKQPKP